MNEANLSIIIPHYNSPKTLIKLLNSIFSESGDDVEVIVVDDNSDKYLDEYSKCKEIFMQKQVLFLKNNNKTKGAGVSRNIGLQNSSGKWVMFADADDYLLPGWYKCVDKYFQSNDDIIFFYPTSINLQTMQKGHRELNYTNILDDFINGIDGAECKLRYCFVVPWSKLIKREFIDIYNIKFDCTKYSNDVMFSTKVGYSLKTFHVDKNSIYCVTEGSDTLTAAISKSAFYTRLQVAADRYIFLKERLTPKEWKYLPIKNEPLQMLYAVIKRKDGLKFFYKCFRYFKKKNIPIITKYSFLLLYKKVNKVH